MNLEERKNNIYFDATGKQILVGDLLKVFHYNYGKGNKYMYHVVVIQETDDFPVMAAKDYSAVNPHYRLYILCDNERRVYKDAKIISSTDFETKRKRIKITPNPAA